MITSLGTLWSSADITSNGTFAQILTGTEFPKTYVVSNCIATDSFQILRTIDGGQTFDEVAVGPAGPSFDPVVYMKNDILYFVGARPNTDPLKTDLVMYSYNTADDAPGTPTVLTPTVLVTGTRIHSGYDLVCLPDGTFIVVTSVTQPTTPVISGSYALIAVHVNALMAATGTDTITTASSIRAGEAYGGVSLVLNGTLVELFYTAHQKRVTFGAARQEIRRRTYETTDLTPVWSNETLIQGYSSHFIDDKLTVVPLTGAMAGDLVLSSLFYVQEKGKLYSVMQIGSRVSGVWRWMAYRGTTSWSFMEPTLTVSEDNDVYLMHTEGDVNTGGGGLLRISSVDVATLKYTQQAGNWSKFNFKWLRGSKNPIAASDLWVLVGEHTQRGAGNVVTGYTPYYVSHLNLAPIVTIIPTTATLERDTLLRLSAAGTIDPDYDTLTFAWTTTGNAKVHLIPVPGAPSKMDVRVENSVGPNPYTFSVTVSAQDVDAYGTPIHTAVTASTDITVPLNHAPIITWDPSEAMTVTRNSIIVLEPVITDAEANDLTYSWTQTSGPALTVLGPVDLPYLVIRTHGVDVYGSSVQFTLAVSDGINDAVASTATLTIPSINFANADQKFLSRSIYMTNGGSSILERNNTDGLSEWSALEVGAVSSSFFRSKYTRDFEGHRRQLYISPRTCAVIGAETPFSYYFRKVFLPGNDRGLIVDAILVETDDVIVLNDDYKLLRYSSSDTGVLNMRDDYQGYTDLKPYMREAKVKWFTAAPLVGGSRVLAFVTDKGVLLVQVRESDFKPQAALFLSMFDLSLYGGDDVLFVRFKGVEHLRKGQVLIGTKAPKEALLSFSNKVEVNDFEFFETIFDLNNRTIVDVWDRTNRINERVYTGEFLAVGEAEYSGLLQAPVLHIAAVDDVTAYLTWDMIRPDLVKQYTVYLEETPGIPNSSIRVPPVVNGFKGIPRIVNYGEPTTLKWDVDNANEVKVDGVGYPLSVTQTTIIPKTTRDHLLTARNAWGITEKLTNIVVLPHAPTIKSFTATQSVATLGATVQFFWDVTGADTLVIDQGVGNVTGRTSKSAYIPQTTTYQLFAINTFGSTAASVVVTVP